MRDFNTPLFFFFLLILLTSVNTSAQLGYTYASNQTEFYYEIVENNGNVYSAIYDKGDKILWELSDSIRGDEYFLYDADLFVELNGNEVTSEALLIRYRAHFETIIYLAVNGEENYFENYYPQENIEISGNEAVIVLVMENITITYIYEKDTGILQNWKETGPSISFEMVSSTKANGLLAIDPTYILPALFVIVNLRRNK